MRKILVFLLLLSVFLLAVIIDWNVRKTSESIRSSTAPADIRDDDVFELLIGFPPGETSRRGLAEGRRDLLHPSYREPAGKKPPVDPAAEPPRSDPSPSVREDRTPRHIYIVKEGDTLTSIARKLFNDEDMVEKLIEWNRLRTPDKIFPGEPLRYLKDYK